MLLIFSLLLLTNKKIYITSIYITFNPLSIIQINQKSQVHPIFKLAPMRSALLVIRIKKTMKHDTQFK